VRIRKKERKKKGKKQMKEVVDQAIDGVFKREERRQKSLIIWMIMDVWMYGCWLPSERSHKKRDKRGRRVKKISII